MSLLYFSDLHPSVSEYVLRDAITKLLLYANSSKLNKQLFTLSLQLPDAPAAGVKNINGAGSIRFYSSDVLNSFMAKLKTEPIMFKSQAVCFSFDAPKIAVPIAPIPGPSTRSGAKSTFNATQPVMATARHATRKATAPVMNINKTKAKYGQRPQKTIRLNPLLLRKEHHRLSILGQQPRLKKIHFGVLRNNVFSIEYSKDLLPTAGYLKFDDDEKTLRIIVGGTHQVGDELIPSVAIAIQTVYWVGLGNDGLDDYMFLELVQHPHLEQGDQFRESKGTAKDDARGSRIRLSQLDKSHGRIAPYASRWLKITFHEDTETLPNEEICFLAGLPQPIMDPYLIFEHTRRAYSPSNIELVENWLRSGSLSWEVTFQCEALFRNGTLVPKEIMLLQPRIEEIASESDTLACDALKSLQDELKGVGARTLLAGFEDEGIVAILDKLIEEARKGLGGHFQNSGSTFVCHHVKVTPTAICLDGPYAEQSNRVIRRYPGFESYFIRVNFKDEGESRTRLEFEVDNQSFSKQWIGKFLKAEGINIGNRHYKLLGYSSSGFREHACFFSSEFTYKGVSVTPESIRASLGDFSKVIYCPARYGARMSQAFSSTDPSVILPRRVIKDIPDLMNAEGEVFSDGCGTISPSLAKKVWEGWVAQMPETRRRLRHKDEPLPAAFQIRMGGCKGMVRIDPKLKGEQLCIRPSMTKFEAPNELSFEIARAFERWSPCFLNRPLVMLLVTNGVDPAIFERLMDDTLKSIKNAMETFDGVRSILVSSRLGRACHLGNTFAKLSRLGIELNRPGVQSVGLRKLLNAALYHVKLGLKHKARIEVPNSYTLVGVCDEDAYLKPRDIYACVQTFDHKTGVTKKEYIKGWVLVSRSPYIHPGDCQKLYAIGEPPDDSPFTGEGNHLPNCVVFSSRGHRPDLFNIIRISELMPPHEYSPATYAGPDLEKILTESTMDDVADFMVEFICNDSVAAIAVNHLIIASIAVDGARNVNCIINAELHSMAVDFFKTGKPVPADEIKKPKYDLYKNPVTGLGLRPDWQVGHGRDPEDGRYYPCESVLGKLFRAVELPLGNPARDEVETPQDFDKSNTILKLLAAHVAKYQAQIKTTYAGATPWVQALLARYTLELNHICVSHTVASESTERVSEVEVMLGTNLESAENKSLVERMKVQTNNLADYARFQLQGDTDDDPYAWLARAWRAYTLTSGVGYEKFGAFSFSWIALGSVLDALQALDKTFLSDIGPIRPLCADMSAYSGDVLVDLDEFAQVDRENWPWIDEVKSKSKQNKHPRKSISVSDPNTTNTQNSEPCLNGDEPHEAEGQASNGTQTPGRTFQGDHNSRNRSGRGRRGRGRGKGRGNASNSRS